MVDKSKVPKHFSLLYVPGEGTEVKRISLPLSWLRYLPYAAASLVVVAFGFIFLFFFYRFGYLENQRSKEEISQMKRTMGEVHSHLNSLEKTLERLNSLDAKLRMMTHLRDPERQLAMGPVTPEETMPEDSFDSPFDEILPYLQSDDTPAHPDEVLVNVRRLQDRSQQQEASMVDLTAQLANQEFLLAATPAIWPVKGFMTSSFGM